MPGAYAHITLVNLARDINRLETADVPIRAIQAVLGHLGFCELGAVSPDYPYLHIGLNGSKRWADLMHYERTGEPIKKGIEFARSLNPLDKAPVAAWLMGYAAHVVADVTIHPVVEMRVGEYATHSQAHRICELNQDAYVFRRLNLDDVGRSEHLNSGIWRCCDAPDSGKLDRSIFSTWEQMLSMSYPDEFKTNKPDIHAWHAGFKRSVDLAEEGYRMPLFARHLAVDCGITYPAVDDIDYSYIKDLETPDGAMDYDQLFDKAIANVVAMWSVIGKALYEDDQAYRTKIGNWNLDTGKDAAGNYAYWPDKEIQHA
jgi:hypothetical protein